MNRRDTFLEVANLLDLAVIELEKAAEVLKESVYWSGTSERKDILDMVNKSRQLSRDFKV